jgi:hypothetical protein
MHDVRLVFHTRRFAFGSRALHKAKKSWPCDIRPTKAAGQLRKKCQEKYHKLDAAEGRNGKMENIQGWRCSVPTPTGNVG